MKTGNMHKSHLKSFYEALSYCPEKGEIALIGYREIPDYKWESNIPKMIRELNVYKRNSKNDCEDTRYDLNAILSFFFLI